MQLAVIEFARHAASIARANSTEFDPETDNPVVALITEWLDREGRVEKRTNDSDMGGTMRLGAYPAMLDEGSIVAKLYGSLVVSERHRHRYEFNAVFKDRFEAAGMMCSGTSPDGRLVEFVELPSHPYFVGTQAHPEFKSRPDRAHPLFDGLIVAAAFRSDGREPQILKVGDASYM
jgi:CTP synthase